MTIFGARLPAEAAAAAAALSCYGACTPVDLPAGRTAYYVLAYTTFAVFGLAGPAGLFASCAGVALALAVMLARGAPRGRIVDLLSTALSLALAAVAGHVVLCVLGGGYPLGLASLFECVRVVCVQTVAFGAFVGLKEALGRASGSVVAAAPTPDMLERPALYGVSAVVLGPVQLLPLALYATAGAWAWVVALGVCVPIQAMIPIEVRRARRLRALLAERAAKERGDALAEVTTRVAHQMRHQLGLIGLSLHRLSKHLDSLGGEHSAAVREELENLARAQDELRSVLSHDLRPPPAGGGGVGWGELVRGPVGRVELLAKERGVRLSLTIDELPAGGPQAARKFEQAWFNVVENAVAAAHTRVTIVVRAEGEDVVFSVDDDGPGMTDEVFSRATEPFFTTKQGGTGMGLAIARAVAEELRGELRIERGGAGLRVSIRLPRGRPARG